MTMHPQMLQQAVDQQRAKLNELTTLLAVLITNMRKKQMIEQTDSETGEVSSHEIDVIQVMKTPTGFAAIFPLAITKRFEEEAFICQTGKAQPEVPQEGMPDLFMIQFQKAPEASGLVSANGHPVSSGFPAIDNLMKRIK